MGCRRVGTVGRRLTWWEARSRSRLAAGARFVLWFRDDAGPVDAEQHDEPGEHRELERDPGGRGEGVLDDRAEAVFGCGWSCDLDGVGWPAVRRRTLRSTARPGLRTSRPRRAAAPRVRARARTVLARPPRALGRRRRRRGPPRGSTGVWRTGACGIGGSLKASASRALAAASAPSGTASRFDCRRKKTRTAQVGGPNAGSTLIPNTAPASTS
jgi:hypothetical protein